MRARAFVCVSGDWWGGGGGAVGGGGEEMRGPSVSESIAKSSVFSFHFPGFGVFAIAQGK